MRAIRTPAKRASKLMFVLLVASARPAIGDEPLAVRGIRDELNELSVVDALELSSGFLGSALEAGSDAASESHAKFALLDGLNKLRRGDPKSAVEALTVAIKAKPMDHESYWLRGRALAKLGQFAKAKEDCHQALKINKELIPAQLTLAGIALETDGAVAALRIIDQNCSSKGDHGDLCYEHYLRAVAYINSEQPELAIDHVEIALRGSFTYLPVPASELWFVKATAHERAGELENALQSASRSIEANEKHAKSLILIWTLQRKLGNHLAAFEAAKRLSDSDAESVKYRLLKLRSLADLKQYRALESEATEILSIEPENKTARQVLDRIQTARAISQAGLKQE